MVALVLVCWVQNCPLRCSGTLESHFSTADAPLLPVCAISGHGISMSSSCSSGCSELTQKTQFLTTGDPRGHARTCLPPPSARELNVRLNEYLSNIPARQPLLLPPATLEVSAGPRIPSHFLFWPLSGSGNPPAVAQLPHSASEVASCTWCGGRLPPLPLPTAH